MTLFASLRHRPFAWLWSGQTISRLGDNLYSLALAWWVLQTTGSATAMGTVLIFSYTPMLLFLLIGGVAVDRLPRLRVMFVADLARGLVVLAVAALAAFQRLEIWHVYVASMLFGFLQAFFFPAYNAVVPELTPAAALPSANSLTSLSQQLSGIVGPAVGAWVVASSGTPAAFALDGLSFLIAAACVLPLLRKKRGAEAAGGRRPGDAPPPPAGAGPARGSAWVDLREGIVLVLRAPWLWITITVSGLLNITLSGPRAVALPFLVERTLHANVGTLGLLYSAAAAGAVLGSLWLGRRQRLRRRGLLAYAALVICGLASVVLGLAPLAPAAAIGVATTASFVMGACVSAFGLVWTNTLQERVPRDKLGRVSSIDALGSYALLPLGYGLTGWATDRLGPPLVFILGGSGMALLAFAAWLHPAIRKLD